MHKYITDAKFPKLNVEDPKQCLEWLKEHGRPDDMDWYELWDECFRTIEKNLLSQEN